MLRCTKIYFVLKIHCISKTLTNFISLLNSYTPSCTKKVFANVYTYHTIYVIVFHICRITCNSHNLRNFQCDTDTDLIASSLSK